MTRTLITNDDGIDAPGLHALATAARAAGLEVTVAAPMRQSSGSSASSGSSRSRAGPVLGDALLNPRPHVVHGGRLFEGALLGTRLGRVFLLA